MITDLLTTLIDNIKVGGKFNQSQILLGRGVDEQITIHLDGGSAAIRYLPATVSDSAKIQFTSDGTNWISLGESAADYEPILFRSTDLDSSGLLHIQHNLGSITGLSYTMEPRDINISGSTITLDYSNCDIMFSQQAVWFNGSRQNMLVATDLVPSNTVGITMEV